LKAIRIDIHGNIAEVGPPHEGITVDLGIPGAADPKQKASTRHDD